MIPAVFRFLYTLLLLVLVPVLLLRLCWKALGERGYLGGMRQRFARALPPAPAQSPIWIHAVSLGEVRSVLPLARALHSRGHPLWMTTTTPAGHAEIQRLAPGFCDYSLLPFDLPWLQKRFIRHVKPKLLLMMETELWPNQLAACQQLGVPSMLVNGRLNERSARRYAFAKSLIEPIDLVAARSPVDAERFAQLGLRRVEVAGDLKLCVPNAEELTHQGAEIRQRWGAAPVWIAGSTHPGEDELILAAHQQVRHALPDARLVIAPRHLPRVEQIVALAQAAGPVCLRSQTTATFAVMVVDTHGELPLLYAAADVAMVCGSLINRGGHNLYEPVVVGTAAITGASVFNFASMYKLLKEGDAIAMVEDADALAVEVVRLLQDQQARTKRVQAGERLAQTGAQTLEHLLRLVEEKVLL